MELAGESLHGRLKVLGLTLPPAPAPAAAYAPARREGDLIWLAGQLPFVDGSLPRTGRVGAELDLETGTAMARTAALNCLAVLHDLGVDLARIRPVNLVVYVASAPHFRDQHLVANGASTLLLELLEGRGSHARTTVPVPFLPLDSPLEIQSVFSAGS